MNTTRDAGERWQEGGRSQSWPWTLSQRGWQCYLPRQTGMKREKVDDVELQVPEEHSKGYFQLALENIFGTQEWVTAGGRHGHHPAWQVEWEKKRAKRKSLRVKCENNKITQPRSFRVRVERKSGGCGARAKRGENFNTELASNTICHRQYFVWGKYQVVTGWC